jgi:hypothetical protein
MIQRKQTIFLALALLSFLLLFFLPFANFKIGTVAVGEIYIYGFKNFEGYTKFNYMFIVMQVLVTLFISLIGITIFMYKKRALQIRLCAFAFLTNVFMIGAIFLTTTIFTNALELPKDSVNYLLPTYLPLVTLLFVMGAQRAIRKDDAMVRSLNRLR